jgi:hypothetical protein
MSKKKHPEMTTLEKAQLLSKLLKHVERANKGNTLVSFRKESASVCIKSNILDENKEPIIRRIEMAAAERFFKYLVANKHLEKAQDKTMRNCIPDKCRKEGSDPQMSWLMDVVTFNDPFKSRGRIAGVSPRKKIVIVEEEELEKVNAPACFTEDIFHVEDTPQTMADIVVDFGPEENTSSLLDGVEIVNPQIMEDDVLDGYNEITGEFDKLPEQDSVTKLMIDLAPLVERAKNLGITIVISNK